MMTIAGRVLKMVTVGDGEVGKTCLLIAYTQGAFNDNYVPTVFDNYAGSLKVDGQDYHYTLWDTAGQEAFDRCRVLAYHQTNVFLVCFSLACRNSYLNVSQVWLPEIRRECGKGIPVVLVGTKCDLRKDPSDTKMVSRGEGKKLAKTLGVSEYVECSAKTMTGLNDVFTAAVRAAVNPLSAQANKRHRCVLL